MRDDYEDDLWVSDLIMVYLMVFSRIKLCLFTFLLCYAHIASRITMTCV